LYQDTLPPPRKAVISFDSATAMAFVIHGIGTMVYGQRDYWPDGSFVTTEWVVVGWVPLFPIISKRISYTRNSDYATYDSAGYWVYETLPLDRRQVFFTYGWLASVIVPFVVFSRYQDTLAKKSGDADWVPGLFLLFLVISLSMPYSLRRWVKRRKAQEWKRQSLGLHG
jgi:hypothetical protein